LPQVLRPATPSAARHARHRAMSFVIELLIDQLSSIVPWVISPISFPPPPSAPPPTAATPAP
jgi:hypothetical protein